MPDRDLTRKHVGYDREEHWLMRKKARVRERSEQELDRLLKMTVQLQQPTAVMQQEPSSSPSLSPTAPMQEPTQDIQNELMDSPMEKGAQEHREQRKVRLNETSSSEMSKRLVVKARPAHSPTIAPMMESLGSTVLLDPAPFSKDETTTGSARDCRNRRCDSSCPRGGCVAVRGDENVRERDSVSREQVRSATQKKVGKEKPKKCKSSLSSKSK